MVTLTQKVFPVRQKKEMHNARQLKKENTRSVIQVIRNSSEFTKPEIAQATGLTGATVHGTILKLEEIGLLDTG